MTVQGRHSPAVGCERAADAGGAGGGAAHAALSRRRRDASLAPAAAEAGHAGTSLCAGRADQHNSSVVQPASSSRAWHARASFSFGCGRRVLPVHVACQLSQLAHAQRMPSVLTADHTSDQHRRAGLLASSNRSCSHATGQRANERRERRRRHAWPTANRQPCLLCSSRSSCRLRCAVSAPQQKWARGGCSAPRACGTQRRSLRRLRRPA